jgi:uroporphyrin-III C-methyltransferase
MSGFVSLVGAGPGDPELITVKALRRLAAADVIVYDALVHPDTLALGRADAERIPAGKRGGRPSAEQDWITNLLIEKARAGYQVVRLKGGDPFVFGRGGEEAEALAAAGILWEIVPGISSAIAAPAYAGIPVTHRDAASSVAIVTGHENPQRPESRLNWAALAQGIDTLVILMGISQIEQITTRLIAHGRAASTPAVVIRSASTSEQACVSGTLATIAEAVAAAGITAPATLVVGDVAAYHQQLQWFDAQPSSVLSLDQPLKTTVFAEQLPGGQ